ncbi:MAG: isoprenyl transferase [Prevotellaceae bacterium]|jgi:undecaprenyl diphosphate synthase|nr:isoprenyl transferase [Prevotellaceae bacterium]
MHRLDKNKIPGHVAVIMDGNGRWAKRQGLKRIFGHRHALHSVRSVVEGAGEIGIKFLTLFAFSTENWNRPKDEIEELMNMLVSALEKELPDLHKNNVRLKTIGNISKMNDKVQEKLKKATIFTAENTGLTLTLALNYGSREEIIECVKCCVQDVINNNVRLDEINEMMFSSKLYTNNMPDPELIIRTSGEQRISNFLLWQAAYSEFYFTETFWPDFRKQHLFDAVYDYQQRERRFGKTSEQIKKYE